MSATHWPLEVKREHVALLAFCWIDMIPRYYDDISVEEAAEVFGKFRANPKDPSLACAKRMANEMWVLYVQSN